VVTKLLELAGVTKGYPSPAGDGVVPVLRDVDLRVEAGETVAIMGPSGSGKSTLLNIIGALDRPDAGRVLLDGTDLATLGESELAAVRSARIGFIFQLHHLLPQCTALENVLIPTLAARSARGTGGAGGGRETSEDRARRLLDRVGLGGRMDHWPGQLSGGERQRVAVVRALINQPGLLLADEPTGSLDRAAAESLAQLLAELNREEGVALIVVTHSASLAAPMARTLELQDGRLVTLASPGTPVAGSHEARAASSRPQGAGTERR
jgi:ABC-type lipoprotein export system ATPase subunit